MSRGMMRNTALLLALLLLVSVGGVYAVWQYAEPPYPATENFDSHVGLFDYTPEEVLPGGDSNEKPVTPGANHYGLIDLILNEADKGYGLNINQKPVLHNCLKTQRVVYCNQKVSGGNLRQHILVEAASTHGLYYCIEKISDTEYHAYTFSMDDLEAAGSATVEIAAYKTILIKNTKWEATTSYLGHAMTRSLRDLGVSADSGTIGYSIDVTTWHAWHA